MRARGTYTPGSGFGRVARRVLRNQRDTLGQREKSTERERERESKRDRKRAWKAERRRRGEARRVKASQFGEQASRQSSKSSSRQTRLADRQASRQARARAQLPGFRATPSRLPATQIAPPTLDPPLGTPLLDVASSHYSYSFSGAFSRLVRSYGRSSAASLSSPRCPRHSIVLRECISVYLWAFSFGLVFFFFSIDKSCVSVWFPLPLLVQKDISCVFWKQSVAACNPLPATH